MRKPRVFDIRDGVLLYWNTSQAEWIPVPANLTAAIVCSLANSAPSKLLLAISDVLNGSRQWPK